MTQEEYAEMLSQAKDLFKRGTSLLAQVKMMMKMDSVILSIFYFVILHGRLLVIVYICSVIKHYYCKYEITLIVSLHVHGTDKCQCSKRHRP